MRVEQAEAGVNSPVRSLEFPVVAPVRELASTGRIVFASPGVIPPISDGSTVAELEKITSDPEDSTAAYLREISRIPLLTREQEVALAIKIEAGRIAKTELDKLCPDYQARLQKEEEIPPQAQQLADDVKIGDAARSHLIEANLRLVVSNAKKYSGKGMSFLDLIQEGNIGLMRAVEKFDHRRGFKFSTYATHWIRQSITRGIAGQGRTIRLPVHIIEQLGRIKEVGDRLSQELGREPTDAEIGLKLGIPEGNVRRIIQASWGPASLDEPAGEYGITTCEDFLPDQSGLGSPDERMDRIGMRVVLEKAMESLSVRERRILELRFGLKDGIDRTLEEVGVIVGLTRERVRQIEANALRKLRHPDIREGLEVLS